MNPSTPFKPLRVWPGVAIVIVQWIFWVVVPRVVPGTDINGLLGGVGCGLLVLLWWLFFSRAPWVERFGAIVLMVAGVIAVRRVVHESIAGAGMGMLLFFYSVPALSLALVTAAVIARHWTTARRRGTLAAAILIGCGALAVIRTDGVTGEFASDFHWRWTPTAEERLLAEAGTPLDTPAPLVAPPPAPAPPPAGAAATGGGRVFRPGEKGGTEVPPSTTKDTAVWPGFRGPVRDNIVRGVRLDTDWSRSKPVEIWRHPVGPGWSSFSVDGDFIYTQEQRGSDEVVSCYRLSTGAPVWRHKDATRFYESNAGAGPRGTPTLSGGRVYTLGATGVVNALDARDGSVIWSRNAATDTGAPLPDWGFAGSPLVKDDLVVVATAGRYAAYDIATGRPRWSGESGGSGYSSPHLATIGGVEQIVLLNTSGAISLAPSNGQVLWKHEWRSDGIVQPSLIDGSDILMGSGFGGELGTRRISVTRTAGGWTTAERWTSQGLKPYFNDFVVHEGHAYGFDGAILACIDLADGKRKWKGGRYGHGQLIVLSEQDVLLVLSEEGELALVSATPDQFTELSRVPAIEGKTWNHPVLVGDILLVRNAEEMAAFRVKLLVR